MKHHYYQHKIYCDLDFKSLFSYVIDYFVSKGFMNVGEETTLVNQALYYEGVKSSLSIFVAETLARAERSGAIGIYVKNLKGRFSRQEISFLDLPEGVRKRFVNYPNVLIVDLHTYWYSYHCDLVFELIRKLREIGIYVYDSSFNGRLLGVYDQALSPEDRISAINTLVLEFFKEEGQPELDLDNFTYEQKLLLPSLSNNSLHFLKAGELIRVTLPYLPEFSPVIIAYSKIVECEVSSSILIPLRKKLENRNSDEFNTPKALKKLKQFIKGGRRDLELGTLANMLKYILKNEEPTDLISIAVLELIELLPIKIKLEELVTSIFYITRNFRNKAAHKEVLVKEDVNVFREYLFGSEKEVGFLEKLLWLK